VSITLRRQGCRQPYLALILAVLIERNCFNNEYQRSSKATLTARQRAASKLLRQCRIIVKLVQEGGLNYRKVASLLTGRGNFAIRLASLAFAECGSRATSKQPT
jgi:DNA-directed RNA polymerase specialized sigma24 family protein